MKRFEYRVIAYPVDFPVAQLNALGNEGWQVATVVPRALADEGLADAVVLMREKGEA